MSDMDNRSKQPSIMNIRSVPVNTEQMIESDVLEPLTFSQTEATWEFAPKGFLHPDSALVVGFENNTDIPDAFPFINSGVKSIVRRAVLRTTAGRVICDTDECNKLQVIKECFLSNSGNKERDQYLSGRCIDFQFVYSFDTSSDLYDNQDADGYTIDNGNELNCVDTGTHEGLFVKNHLKLFNGSTFQIKLHDLFPYMKAGNQLPLFILPNERIQVQIFWANPDGKNRMCLPASLDGKADEVINLDRTKCKIISDHIFYDGETMDKFRREHEKGLTFGYIDYRVSKQSMVTNDDSQQTERNTRNIGGQGMVVNKVYFNYNDPNTDALDLCVDASEGAIVDDTGDSREPLTSNLFINGKHLYPLDIDNTALHFHCLKEAGGMVPFLSRELYSGEGEDGISDDTQGQIEGRNAQVGLSGKFFGQGFLTAGLNERIDNRGIILESSVEMPNLKASTIQSYTQNAWLEIRRYVVINNGHLECYFV